MRSVYGNKDGTIWGLLTWRELSQRESSNRDFATARATRTIKHEILHGFGLSHPNGPYGGNPKFNDLDTVMSYNNTSPLPNYVYTAADRTAAVEILNRIKYGSLLPDLGPKMLSLDKSIGYNTRENGDVIIGTDQSKELDDVSTVVAQPKGTSFNDRIFARASTDKIQAFAGDDQIISGGNRLTIAGGPGYDQIYLGEKKQKVILDAKNVEYDTIFDFGENDIVFIEGGTRKNTSISLVGETSFVTVGGSLVAVVEGILTDGQVRFGFLA
jgi:hypothetical protein